MFGQYFCLCGGELEDHGHTHGGDYVTYNYDCTICHKNFDYDSRRENEWIPCTPFYDLPPEQTNNPDLIKLRELQQDLKEINNKLDEYQKKKKRRLDAIVELKRQMEK